MIPDITALLFLCGHPKIKHLVKLYFYAHTLKTSSCCILENFLQYLGTMKVHIRVHFKARESSAVHRCSEGVKLVFLGCSREQLSVSVANEQDIEGLLISFILLGYPGEFLTGTSTYRGLILLLIESYVLETSVASFLHFQSSGEPSPVISVRIQHHVVTKLLVTYWFSLYCLVH